jgi:MFS family permease
MQAPFDQPLPSTGARNPPITGSPVLLWTLAALFLLNTMNYVDRLLFSVAQEAIKADLRLSDFQLGLLGGPAFALLYTLASFPIARLADRGNRVTIISIAFATWSAMTAFCGVATNFVQMLFGRAAVSIGEAGCTPPAHSLISDTFPAERRTTVMAIFVSAGPVGSLIAAIAGGWIVQVHGWRAAFIICGVIGIVLAIVTRFTVPEPPRRQLSHHQPLLPTFRTLLGKRSFVAVTIAGAIAGIGSFSNHQYMVSFLMRAHDLPLATASTLSGLVFGGVGIFVTLGAGAIMDRGRMRFPRIRIWLPALGMLWSGVLYAGGFQMPVAWLSLTMFFVASLGQHFYMPAMFSLGQELAPPHMRAMASAIIISVISLLGYGIGPPAVGYLSDLFRGMALAQQGLSAAGCELDPGPLCQAASATGLRWSLTLGSCFFILAGICFALAGRWVNRDLVNDEAPGAET